MIKKSNLPEPVALPDAETEIADFYSRCRMEFITYVCRHYPVDEDAAKDIYQDSFMAMYQNIRAGKFTPGNASLKTYLFGIGRKQTAKYLNRQGKFRETEITDLPDDVLLPDESDGEWMQMCEITRQEVSKMENLCRQVLSLFYWKRKSMWEIAQIMHYKNEQGAKNRKSICGKMLRQQLVARFRLEGIDYGYI
ncbi:MAG: sigma-70 family RNA polymerase sigma factor [Tannerella sp.]|jgi:RNA polymerase sigma factor (sigma-70 family)|nr:sigma-70 family RNA polymerase sigma factor [Tannerella sp.]